MYHWQSDNSNDSDERYHRSVELSYTEVKAAVESYGFKFTVRAAVFLDAVLLSCRV